MTTQFKSNRFINTILTVGATSLLLGAASVHAADSIQQRSQDIHQAQTDQRQSQQTNQQANQKQDVNGSASDSSREFSAADTNQDDILVWTEIWAVHEDDLTNADMDEESTLSTYDTNRDDGLDTDEYAVFITDITQYPVRSDSANQSARAESASQQDRSELSQSEQSQYNERSQEQSGELSSANAQRSERNETSMTNTEGRADNETLTERPVVFHQAFIAVIDSGTSPEELKDRTVTNAVGEEIGEVEDVVMSNDGSEAGVVVGVGGVLGMGEKEIFLSAEELSAGANGEEIVWERSLGEDSAENLPEYDEERYTSLTEDA